MENALKNGYWNPPNQVVVAMANNRSLNLSDDVIRLVNDGIYSLYSIKGSSKLILITDTREFYLLDEKGNFEEKLTSLAGFPLQSPIRVQDIKKYSGYKVNYA
ncbi:MAG: hypothetical protein ACXVCN_16355 [Bdellovibrio sp.]